MRSISNTVFVASLVLGCEGFAPTLYMLPKASRLSIVSQSRSLRVSPKASLTTEYYNAMAVATNLLLAVDSDESKVDRLYNGIPATGAVEVCSLVFCCDISSSYGRIRRHLHGHFQFLLSASPFFWLWLFLFSSSRDLMPSTSSAMTSASSLRRMTPSRAAGVPRRHIASSP